MSTEKIPNENWLVVELKGKDVRDLDMRFEISEGDELNQNVFGQAPCNSFRAMLQSAEGEFNLMILDKRGNVCSKELMEEEREYMRVLKRLSHYEIRENDELNPTRRLYLISFGDPTIVAIPED